VFERFDDVVDWTVWKTAAFEDAFPFAEVVLCEAFVQEVCDFSAVVDAFVVGIEFADCGVWDGEKLAEEFPLAVVVGGDEERAVVTGFVAAVGD